jgi:hypothetical protein
MINNLVEELYGLKPLFYSSEEKIFLCIFYRRKIAAMPPK